MTSKLYQYIFPELRSSNKLKKYLKAIEFISTESINVMRIGEDIILTDGNVPLHTDNTEIGKDSIMFVIISQRHLFRHEQCNITLQPGTFVRFNGNQMHGLSQSIRGSRFAAIIWDIKLHTSIDDLVFDLSKRLKELDKEIYKKSL